MWNQTVRDAVAKLLENEPNIKDVIAYMEEAAKAQAQSDALDDAGFQRKSVDDPTPDPVVEKATDGKCPKCGKTMTGGKCPDHGAMDTAEEAGETPKKSIDPKPTLPPTGEQKKGLQPETPARAMLGKTRPLLTSDIGEMYEAITEIFQTMVQKAVSDATNQILGQVSKALEERDAFLAEHEKKFGELSILDEAILNQKAYDSVVEAVNDIHKREAELQEKQADLEQINQKLLDLNVTPRISSIFKAFAASESPSTEIDDEHPLSKAHPAETADGMFAKYGLKPTRVVSGNGTSR